jgi:hypothetical protein
MNRSIVIAALVVVVLVGGLYGTFGLGGAAADRSITIEVVDQAGGILGVDADHGVVTSGNETTLARVSNRGIRTFRVTESVDDDTRIYSLDPAESETVVVDVDCNATDDSVYVIEIVAETDEPEGNLRIESTTTVDVRCRS